MVLVHNHKSYPSHSLSLPQLSSILCQHDHLSKKEEERKKKRKWWMKERKMSLGMGGLWDVNQMKGASKHLLTVCCPKLWQYQGNVICGTALFI